MCRFLAITAILMCAYLFGTIGVAQELVPDPLPATVEGTIVNEEQEQVTVRLEAVRPSPLGYSDGYIGTVAPDGHFRFENVLPGKYRLTAEAPAYLYAELGSTEPDKRGTILEIKAGQHLEGLTLALIPDPPSVCAHVSDAQGRPLQAVVEIFSTVVGGDGPRTTSYQPAKLTGEDGFFNFSNLWPQGYYFLRANGVWYPSNDSYSGAQTVEPIQASRSGCTADIRMPSTSAPVYQVTGKIEGKLAHTIYQYDATLFAIDPGGSLFPADSHPLYRPDSVRFDGVRPGKYAMVVEDHWATFWQYFASPVFSVPEATRTVTLTEKTQTEIQKLAPPSAQKPASIRGELLMDGLTWDQACPMHVSQQPALLRGVNYDGRSSSLDSSGHFTLENVKPGTYTLGGLEILHGTTYLKSLLLDDRPVKDGKITLQPGQSARLQVAISNDPLSATGHLPAGNQSPHYLPAGTYPPATVSGTVTGMSGGSAEVRLRAIRFNSARSMIYRTTTTAVGEFHFAAVDPGIYVLSTEGGDGQYSAYGAKGPGLEGTPVVVTAGQDLKGLVVPWFPRIHPSSSSAGNIPLGFHVRGRVLGALGPPLGDWFYLALTRDDPRALAPVASQALKTDGTFDLSNVWPGRYTLTVRSGYGRTPRVVACSSGPCYSPLEHILATKPISVVDADLNGLELELHPLATLTGEVLLDGKTPDVERLKKCNWTNWTPTLAKQFRNQAPAEASLSADGHFALNTLDEGDYSFFINNFWPEFYMKSILLGGKPIEGRRFHLGFGETAQLVVNIATDGASGRLKNQPSIPPVDPYRDLCRYFGDPSVRRMLIPDPVPPDASGILEGFYNAVGEQSFQGVPPGSYRMLAVENLIFAGLWRADFSQNHEFWVKLAALGQPVEIGPKEHFDLTAPVATEGLQRVLAEVGVPVERSEQ